MISLSSQRHLSWGRVQRPSHRVVRPSWRDDLATLFRAGFDQKVLPYGLGRSYGDSCLNDGGLLIDTGGLDRLISFDRENGIVRCEAGTSIGRLLEVIVPAGFFIPVTPGTKFVTIGGAVANDVHGKNHHGAGTIGRYVRRFELWRTDGGGPRECSRTENPELFAATIGGLGLTGLLSWVELELERIPSAMIDEEVIKFGSLDEFFALEKESAAQFPFTVAWVDCLGTGEKFGRGVFFRGRWAAEGKKTVHKAPKISLPMELPGLALSTPIMKIFNETFYRRHVEKRRVHTVHYEPFFYPLDAVSGWNLAYGKRGFFQVQFVLPVGGEAGFTEILKLIADSGRGSFLAVLKRFGDLASPGMMSFPMPGINLALDFANNGGAPAFLAELDRRIAAHGGRVYPAKDGVMTPATFQCSFPRWREFAAHVDPSFSSDFWRRVTADGSGA